MANARVAHRFSYRPREEVLNSRPVCSLPQQPFCLLSWMTRMKSIFCFPSLVVLSVLLIGCQSPVPYNAATSGNAAEIHYSPAEDLERVDLNLLRSAQHTIDMPMYAFTDKYLAQALMERAEHGVKIRIYRDRTQFEEESARATKKATDDDVLSLLSHQPNIQIRVKSSSTLQHLKSYCVDNKLVRDGSANWSPTGEKRQDNSLIILKSSAAAANFQHNFEQLWNRSDNRVIQ